MALPSELPAQLLNQSPPLADLLQALSHDGPFERVQSAMLQGRMVRPSETVRSLLDLLNDPDRDVRVVAITALGEYGGEAHRTLPLLRTVLKDIALRDSEESVRAAAVRAVLQVGPQPGSEVAGLVQSLQDELAAVRFHAAIALGEFGREAEPAIPGLIQICLRDPDPGVRVEAAVALWKIDHNKAPLAIPTLIKALGDPNELICWIAADCLGQIGAPEAIPAIPALRETLKRSFRLAHIGTGVAVALQRITAAEGAGEKRDA